MIPVDITQFFQSKKDVDIVNKEENDGGDGSKVRKRCFVRCFVVASFMCGLQAALRAPCQAKQTASGISRFQPSMGESNPGRSERAARQDARVVFAKQYVVLLQPSALTIVFLYRCSVV